MANFERENISGKLLRTDPFQNRPVHYRLVNKRHINERLRSKQVMNVICRKLFCYNQGCGVGT